MIEDIDFIITWVDGSDPEWIDEKSKHEFSVSSHDSSNNRYRDWGTLKYWFRSIEKNAPWVHSVYFVTWGHVPSWLNIHNPKLKIIKHSDYIPQKYLPTFSSRAIDMNFHRIHELSERFVYFNDDMFLLKETSPNDFFLQGLPCDSAVLESACISIANKKGRSVPVEKLYLSHIVDAGIINKYFSKHHVIRNNLFGWFNYKYGKSVFKNLILFPWKFFSSFEQTHLPYSYLKSTYSEVWEKEELYMDAACSQKFRRNADANHMIFSYWQIATGRFKPRNHKIGKYLFINGENINDTSVAEIIKRKKYKMVCINDEFEGTDDDFRNTKCLINESFETIFPDKCSFEL